MIIDCHGHYTTAPAPLGEYRDAQEAAVGRDPGHVGEKGDDRRSATTRSATASRAPS